MQRPGVDQWSVRYLLQTGSQPPAPVMDMRIGKDSTKKQL